MPLFSNRKSPRLSWAQGSLFAMCVGCLSACQDQDLASRVTPSTKGLDLSHVETFEVLSVSGPMLFQQDSLRVLMNPYGIAPLSGTIALSTNAHCIVSGTVGGAHPVDLEPTEAGTFHLLQLVGLYPNRVNLTTLSADCDGTNGRLELAVRASALPNNLPDIKVISSSSSRMEPGMALVQFLNGDSGTLRLRPFLLDASGAIRWYLDLGLLGGDGYLARWTRRRTILTAVGNSLHEYDLVGRLVRRKSFDALHFHHDLFEMENEDLLAVTESQTEGTSVIQLDGKSWEQKESWHFRDLLDSSRKIYDFGQDWLHVNAVIHDPSDNSIVVSGRNQGVFKIGSDGHPRWILTSHSGFSAAGPRDGQGGETTGQKPFLLTAVDSQGKPYPSSVQRGLEPAADFDWPWGQHAPSVLPNGNLLLFDNGLERNFGDDSEGFSRAVEYLIDEEERTVQQVWQYGSDRGLPFFSRIVSNTISLTRTGNRWLTSGLVRLGGNHATLLEVTYPEGEVLFEARLGLRDALAIRKGQSGRDADGFGYSDVIYRSERVQLSHHPFSFGQGSDP